MKHLNENTGNILLCNDFKGPLYSLVVAQNLVFFKLLLVLLSHKKLKKYNIKLRNIIPSSINMYTQFEAFSHLYRKLIDQHIVENKLKGKLLKAMECVQKINVREIM